MTRTPRPPRPLRRRALLLAGLAGGAALGAAALRPAVTGAPHSPAFAALARALHADGLAWPTLVIDRARLRRNAERLAAHVRGRLGLRLVNKSLPALGLLDVAAAVTGTARQMVFSLPYLDLIARERPGSDVLLGKPLPAAAAARWLATRPDSGFDPTRQLQWLVDTPARLAQYRELAQAQRQRLRVAIEIDVGLHRGGVPDAAALRPLLAMLAESPWLAWSGFMGYDAHSQKIPDIGDARAAEHGRVLQRYAAFVAEVAASPLASAQAAATFNTGGSPTFRLHDGASSPNEVAVGSALLKPADFDTELLATFEPALFIATPVLKVGEFLAPSGVQALGRLLAAWDRNATTAHYIHGGHWLAQPVSPPGLSPSALIGPSSNQQLLLGSGAQGLRPDDWVFFRPSQSEAVLTQFGDIAVVEDGRVVDRWAPFPPAG